MSTVNDQLRAYFKVRGISQTKIANMLGVTKGTVNKYFAGREKFGKAQAEKWHELFGISKSFLLTGEGSITDEEPARQIEGLMSTINDLNAVITEKNKTIAALQARIAELEKSIDQLNN